MTAVENTQREGESKNAYGVFRDSIPVLLLVGAILTVCATAIANELDAMRKLEADKTARAAEGRLTASIASNAQQIAANHRTIVVLAETVKQHIANQKEQAERFDRALIRFEDKIDDL